MPTHIANLMTLSADQIELIAAAGILLFVALAIRRGMVAFYRFTVFDMAVLATGVYFGIGPWFSLALGGLPLATSIHLPPQTSDTICHAYWIICSYVVTMWVVKVIFLDVSFGALGYSRPDNRFSIGKFFARYAHVSPRTAFVMWLSAWSLRMVLAHKYGIFFSGTATGERVLSLPYYIVIASQLFQLLATGYFIWASMVVFSERVTSSRLVASAIIVTEMVWGFVNGRRAFLSYVIMLGVAFAISKGTLRLRHLIVAAFVAIIISTLVFPFFLYVRHVYFSSQDQEGDAVNLFVGSVTAAGSGSTNRAIELYRENMSTRPLYLRTFLCEINKGLHKEPPMFGMASVRSVLKVVPTTLYPDKRQYLESEQLIQSYFGLKMRDFAITWPAVGYADFGIAGGIGAGILYSFWVVFMAWWADVVSKKSPFVAICVIGTLLQNIWDVEQSPSLVWMLLRNVFILTIMWAFLRGAHVILRQAVSATSDIAEILSA